MKQIILTTCLCIAFLLSVNMLPAQTTTYILFRHAEKDTTQQGSTAMQADPPLTAQGLARAEKLITLLQQYQVDAIYSTNFTRTKATVTPLSKTTGQPIQPYDPRNLKEFSEQLLQMQSKTIVIVGHSNSTPSLVNLLIKENKYPNLDESVYNTYWIVTLENGKTTATTHTY